MFKTRLISGIGLVLVLLALMYLGGDVLLVALGMIALVGLFEFYRVFSLEKSILGYIGYIMSILYFVNLKFHFFADIQAIFILTIMLMLAVMVFTYPKHHVNEIFEVFFGLIYVSVMIATVYLTREMHHGFYLVWLIFIASWGSDTCAYCVGMLVGKHKLAPVLSPKKSIEGAIGGVIGAVLIALVYSVLIPASFHDIGMPYMIIAAIGAVISQIGDLSASGIKRMFKVKDYGHLIPGHGGILDRFDSVIFTAPFVFYLCLLMFR